MKKKSTVVRLLDEIGKNRILLILSLLLAFLSSFTQLYIPILFGHAIDGIVAKGNVSFDIVMTFLTRAAVCILISSLANFLMTLVNNRLSFETVRAIRSKAVHHIQNLPLSYLDSVKTGDIVARVIADADALSDGLLLGFSQLFTGVMTIVLTLVFMIRTSFVISLAVIILTPVSFTVARFISSHTYDMFSKQSATRGQQTACVEEMCENLNVVQAFGYEEKASSIFSEINERLREYATKATFYSSLTNPSTRCVNSIVYAVVALLGALYILSGGLTVGGLSILLNYANQYMKPFNDITSVITELQNAFACADRLFDLCDQKEEGDPVLDPVQKPDLPSVTGEVVLDHVHFRYDADRPLIEDYSLQVKPGMHVALVGPTGCGKTTIINLLMRFYEVNEGVIYLDGHDITSINRNSLRGSYGMVLQDTWLSSGTIRDNLLLAKEDATDEELREACRKSQSLEWIERMENGFDTVITEDRLSAGEKQLLCISRVMLAEPKILILDEATSSIDTRTEILVQRAFDELMKGRTSFVVAHRLSTIRNADLILVMKDGHIIEEGSHDSLLARRGFYYDLFQSQFAGIE